MMEMQTLSGQLDFPAAVILTRLADVLMNNNVLYRLIKPTEQGTEVVSVNQLVNVVPFRRVYRFDRKDELNDFCDQLLKRPLVMQPLVHLGRGLGKGNLACGLCYKDDKWVMMVNQTHPKILSRLQIGLDAAKSAMANGQSCEIRFAFSKMVEKLYKENLTRSEQEKAASAMDLVKTYFRFAEWEYGDLIIRFNGYASLLGRGGGFREVSTLKMTFHFEDLVPQEISWRTLEAEYYPRPHLAPITEDEIRASLPAWTVNSISPLENIGDEIPTTNYSYAQAGRLYESFRKKKRRPREEDRDPSQIDSSYPPRTVVTNGAASQMIDSEEEESYWQEQKEGAYDNESFADPYSDRRARYKTSVYQNQPSRWQSDSAEADRFCEERDTVTRREVLHDVHGHLYPQVKVNTGPQVKVKSSKAQSPYPSNTHMHGANAPPRKNQNPYANVPLKEDQSPYDKVPLKEDQHPYDKVPPRKNYEKVPSRKNIGLITNALPSHHEQNHYKNLSPKENGDGCTPLTDQFNRLRMQGSDRSSHSETGSGIADSGICSDNDGHVREGSYEKPYFSSQQHSPPHLYARDNYAFRSDETDVSDALRKHKELIAKMMSVETDKPQHSDRDSSVPYANRKSAHLSQASKDNVPPSRSVNGLDSYAAARNGQHSKTAGYQQTQHIDRQLMEASFI